MPVDPTGTLLAVANYGDGTVSVHGIDESGRLTDVWTFSHGEPTTPTRRSSAPTA